ncbi:MAG: OmpA family protein [Muribaculaceae bacterium]|nr:OmpA family protein [Muribaculaceae bacterium]
MKKALLALGLAVVAGQALSAQEVVEELAVVQEVTTVEDASQGYLFNRFKDNWFITAEGGANVNFSEYTSHRDLKDRFSPQAALYVGKWFSPIMGLRVGLNWAQLKSLSDFKDASGVVPGQPTVDGYYRQKFNTLGLNFDAMLNITNWWCGYKPNRGYNFIAYAGGEGVFPFEKSEMGGKYHFFKDKVLALRAGIINSFRISKQMALALDIRYTLYEGITDVVGGNRSWNNISANLALTYNFRGRNWSAPIVPVCPEPENCDPLRARLDAANRRIEELEAQLKACLERPVERVVETIKAPLATVYYPIGVSRLSAENARVIKAVAAEMAQHPDQKYTVTGWADNFTGTDAINARLRKNRAAGVEKVLLRNGVNANQLTIVDNNTNNLHQDLGKKCASLDRAVTITENN